MDISRISILFFSPTGHTRRVARYLTEGLRETQLPLVSVNLTDKNEREKTRSFSSDDLVFVLVPVYFGRVPLPMQDLRQLIGNGAAVVPVVVYGHREYEDALRELSDVLARSGFHTIAGAAFLSAHNQIPTLGEGRPDHEDRVLIADFAGNVVRKIRHSNSIDDIRLQIPGEGEYRPYPGMPTAPVPSDDCRHCGLCLDVCPVDIIEATTMKVVDPTQCIGCFACITVCPDRHRHYPSPIREMMQAKLTAMAAANAARKQPTILL